MWAQTRWMDTAKAAVAVALLAGMLNSGRALAVRPDEAALDAAALVQMEQQADRANPREKCFLYTQLLHALAEAAGREILDGKHNEAAQTAEAINRVTAKAEATSARDAKKLKEAEELLQSTTRRLTDMTRALSGEESSAMHSTLQKVNAAHDKILDLVMRQ